MVETTSRLNVFTPELQEVQSQQRVWCRSRGHEEALGGQWHRLPRLRVSSTAGETLTDGLVDISVQSLTLPMDLVEAHTAAQTVRCCM